MAQRSLANGKAAGRALETAVMAAPAVAAGGLSRTLSKAQLVEFYRLMYLSRRTDDREILLKKQQKIFFQISCAGHEALLVAAGMALRPGYDWFFPYYRDRALCLALGNTVEEQLLQAVGAADDPASGGRQMPSHWTSKRLNIVSQSSATATQCLHAVGCAEAGRYFARHPEAAGKPEANANAGVLGLHPIEQRALAGGPAFAQDDGVKQVNANADSSASLRNDNQKGLRNDNQKGLRNDNQERLRNDGRIDYRQFKDVRFHGDEVVYCSIGEGSTSQGEFWESLNTASNGRLPVLYVVEDNGYAISTPVEANTPGGNISRLVANFPNFHFAEVDGTDPVASYEAMVEAVEYCRAGRGPALVHGHVVRPYSHSQSDDETSYRSMEELREDAKRDPLTRMQMWLLREGILDEQGINELERKVEEEIQRASDRALAAVLPRPESILKHVYSEELRPTDAVFEAVPRATADASERTMLDLINTCLRDEMRRDERVVVFGEDVADATRDEELRAGRLKGKGGVFKVTAGLQKEFGNDRVWNSPLAEANIVGRAIGMAVRGMKPVVEIQFFDYIWPAMHQLRNELALMRWRSNGEFSCPLVVRVPAGGYLTGGSIYHSQSGESIFTHTPGVRVVMPSNALDAIGLLRTAIRCDDPVMFLEHKNLYRAVNGRAAYPGPEYTIPFGKAAIARAGKDLTVVTYGAVVPRALQAAQRMQRELGVEVEVLDLRSLSPYDWEAIAESVRKTSKVLVAHEDMLSWGYGAEIAARIGDELFHDLDAPVRRVGAMDTFVAYQPLLEDVILPQPERLFAAMRDLSAF